MDTTNGGGLEARPGLLRPGERLLPGTIVGVLASYATSAVLVSVLLVQTLNEFSESLSFPGNLAVLFIAVYWSVALCWVFFLTRHERRPFLGRLALTAQRSWLADSLLAVLGVLGAAVACHAIVQARGGEGFLGRSTALPGSGVALLPLLVFGQVADEVVFRGYMQMRLSARWGSGAGIVGTALALALFEFDFQGAVRQLSLSLYLGWLAERNRSILPGVLASAALRVLDFYWLDLPLTDAFEAVGFVLPELTLVFGILLLQILRKNPRQAP